VAAVLAAGLGLLSLPVEAQVVGALAARPGVPAEKGPRTILVNADDEYASYLTEAVDFLEAGQYDEAIRILQELMRMPNGGYVPTDTPGVYRGLRLRAAEALTKLDPEGLKRYRMMYDTRARELYNEALAGDVAKLRTVAQIYAQTSYGPRAVERLGAVYFDQGRFLQAEAVWKSLLNAPLEPSERAVLLARLAVASHFAGTPSDRDWLADLKDIHPGARGEMGGRMQDLAEFVEAMREVDPSGILVAGTREVFSLGWPGLGGTPSGTGLMDDSPVLLEPRWTAAANGADRIDSSQLRGNLMALPETLNHPMLRNQQDIYSSRSSNTTNSPVRVELERGHVQIRTAASGQSLQPFTLPSAIEPVIVGDEAIFRTHDAVVAVDVVTGRPIWKTGGPDSADMRMERTLTIQDQYGYNYGYYGGVFYPDMGRYRITVGTNKIYLVSSFRPYVNPYVFQNLRAGTDRSQLADTSRLMAIQIDPDNPTSGDRQGKRVWTVGMGLGDDDLLKGGKYLSAPTYKDDRVYAMVEYIDTYHLVCLDADKGTLVWKSMIAQVPSQGGNDPWGRGMTEWTSRAAPPAVVDGRVYVATNGGVVAAVESDSGLPLWAYQYTSRPMPQRGQIVIAPTAALNPLIVVGDRVLALPADSTQLFCLSAETGLPLWAPLPRRDLNDLSYIDDKRVLLSGGSLAVIDVTTGLEIWPAETGDGGGLEIMGRPAVGGSAVLASGRDCVYRLSLSDYKLTRAELKSPFGVLGNLVCVKGKLIASNAAGICAYFNYEEAFGHLSRRIDAQAARGASATELIFQRAQLSFSDGRFDACLEDLSWCAEAADAGDELAPPSRARLAPWFYRAYVGAANRSATPADMLANFTQASEHATSDQERAHLMVRVMKFYRQNNDLEEALAVAQQLSDRYPVESLVDVRIGPDADDSVRTLESMPEQLARTLAQEFISEIVSSLPGRTAYVKYDAAAKTALDRASAANDAAALEQVADQWPHSLHADTALFRAAEAYTLALPSLTDEKRQEAMGRIVATLSGLTHGGGEMSVRASLALALVWSRGGVKSFADLAISNLDVDQVEAMRDQSFTFAEYTGTIGELLATVAERPGAATAVPTVLVSAPPATWETLFDVKDQNTFIVTDQNYEPVRLMDQVLALKDQRLVLVDTQARDATSAARWTAVSPVSLRMLDGGRKAPAERFVAGLSRDGNVLCVADRESVSGIDVGSQRIIWQKKMGADLGVPSPQFLSIEQGLLLVNDLSSAKLVCVELSTGEMVWQSPLGSFGSTLSQPVSVSGGVAMAVNADGRALLCWDLSNGKVVWGTKANQAVVAQWTPRGLLVVLKDGRLNVHAPGEFKEIWSTARSYPSGDILAVTDDVVVVATPSRLEKVDVLSIPRGGEVVCSLTMGAAGGVACRPTDVQIANGRAYVVSYRQVQIQQPRRGKQPAGLGLSVQAFTLKDGAKLWQKDFDAETMYQLLPLRVCGDAVIVSPSLVLAPQQQVNQATILVLSDSQKGREIAKLSPGLESEPRRQLYSPPVVTNERVLMETVDGLRVIGKR